MANRKSGSTLEFTRGRSRSREIPGDRPGLRRRRRSGLGRPLGAARLMPAQEHEALRSAFPLAEVEAMNLNSGDRVGLPLVPWSM
jgi:hypothetical protein